MEAIEIKNQLRPQLAKLFNVPEEQIEDNTNFFNDLHVDSLMILEVVSIIEREFKVTLKPEEDAAKLSNLRNCIDLTQERTGQLVC
jgi:acyl carrier protein